MAQKPENKLAKKIVEALRARGAWAQKTAGGPFQRGLPDILFIYKSIGGGLEVKLPGRENKVTPLQQATLDAINEGQGFGAVVTSISQALAVLKEIDQYRLDLYLAAKARGAREAKGAPHERSARRRA